MTAHKKNLLRASLITSILLPAVAALVPPTAAVAADRAPPWSWTGLYFGGNAGAAAGTATFSDPQGPAIFGGKVNTAAMLAGLQVGYNWQVAPRWVAGLQADASYLDSNGGFTCMQTSATVVGADCQASPRALASLTGRAGLLVDPLGHTLVYGKGGGAWMNSDMSIIPNVGGSLGETSAHSNAWGWTVGVGIEHALTPAWSVGLEYDYYRFGNTSMAIPDESNTTSVTPDIQVMKVALNYHWDRDQRFTWVDAPAFGEAAVVPVRATPTPSFLQGWRVEAGGRYWYSSGMAKSTSGSGSLLSQLTYDNLTGQTGEFFARVDTPWRLFAKGYVGSGGITNGQFTDEDWGRAADNGKYQLSNSSTSGWLSYAAADVGYNLLYERDYKVGPFVGYSYYRQNINAFGCTYSAPVGQECENSHTEEPATPNMVSISQDETWQSLRVGVSAVATVWGRFGVEADAAYLPYAQYTGLDTHFLRDPVTFFPQNGFGRGVQTELILTYLVTDSFKLGIGGRYWAMWTTNASQSCRGDCEGQSSAPPGPFTANTERFGGFVQASYRFATYP
jgi:opacity protein-like surface antigen/outer membrane protease